MKKFTFPGRANLPDAPFEISREICFLDNPTEYDPKTLYTYSTPGILPKKALQALQECWVELQYADGKLYDVPHPQTTASRIVVLGQHEINRGHEAKIYRSAARKLQKQEAAGRGEVAPAIGATAFNSVALRTTKKGEHLLLLQPPADTSDRGIDFLRTQRQESLKFLGDLAVQSDGPKPRRRAFAELAPDVSIPIARFSDTIHPEYRTEAASYVQEQVNKTLQAYTAPLNKAQVDMSRLEPFTVGPTQIQAL